LVDLEHVLASQAEFEYEIQALQMITDRSVELLEELYRQAHEE